MFRNKILVATLILVIAIILCICFLKKENEIKFVKIGSFDWWKPISSDNPPFGALWWSITQAPESYISLASFSDLYKRATGLNITDTYEFDFDNYTYIVVAGYELQNISYNRWDIWGRFTSKDPWYHGKVVLLPEENKRAINIYRIERILITSDEHSRGSMMDDRRIVILD